VYVLVPARVVLTKINPVNQFEDPPRRLRSTAIELPNRGYKMQATTEVKWSEKEALREWKPGKSLGHQFEDSTYEANGTDFQYEMEVRRRCHVCAYE
jgi:hypothetical protein